MAKAPKPGSHGISWTQRSPILGYNLVTWQLLLVVILPFVFLSLLMIVIGWIGDGEPIFLPWQVYTGVGGFVILLYLSVILLVYFNRYTMEIRMDDDGVRYQLGDRKPNVGKTTATLGALLGWTTAAGAGLLADRRSESSFQWSEIKKAGIWPKQRRVVLYGTLPLLEFYVDEDKFESVIKFIRARVTEVNES